MENPDNVRQAKFVAQLLRVIGILCFISIGFGLPWPYATPAGIACFLVATPLQQFLATRK